jgi:hypothetical protein
MESRIATQIDSFASLRVEVEDLLADATPQNHQRFFENFHISNEVRLNFIRHNLLFAQQSMVKFADEQPRVPAIIHRIWLNNSQNPSVPSKYYLDRILQQARLLGDSYQYVFWHNSQYIASQLGEHFSGVGMTFRDIRSASDDTEVIASIDRAISENKFVLAGDMSKFLILREFGGIYADLGIDFNESLLDLVKLCDVSLFLDQNVFFQPAFMAASANCEIFRLYCRLLARPEILSSIGLCDASAFEAGNEIWLHGGIGFTAALMLSYADSYSILPIAPNRGLLHHESDGSWYRPGNKFGNVILDDAAVTHLDFSLHEKYRDLNRDLDHTFADLSPVQLVRLKIFRHFQHQYWLE